MSIPSATIALPLTAEQQVERLSERKALRRAATASFMGNFVEWFDYAAYGYLATVIALTFFPQTDTTTGCWQPLQCLPCHLSCARSGAWYGGISAINTDAAAPCRGRS